MPQLGFCLLTLGDSCQIQYIFQALATLPKPETSYSSPQTHLMHFLTPTSISQPHWNDSLKNLNSRPFLSIWPQAPFSSLSMLILHFLWKISPPTAPGAQFCPSSPASLAIGFLPTPGFKCFPRSCLWLPSLFFCPLSLGKLFPSHVSSNHLKIKDSQIYTHSTLIL